MAGTKNITENGAKSIAYIFVEKCKRGMGYQEALDEIDREMKRNGYNPTSRRIVEMYFIEEYDKI